EILERPVDAELLDGRALYLCDGHLEMDLIFTGDVEKVDNVAGRALPRLRARNAALVTATAGAGAGGGRLWRLGAAIGEDVGDVLGAARVGSVGDRPGQDNVVGDELDRDFRLRDEPVEHRLKRAAV